MSVLMLFLVLLTLFVIKKHKVSLSLLLLGEWVKRGRKSTEKVVVRKGERKEETMKEESLEERMKASAKKREWEKGQGMEWKTRFGMKLQLAVRNERWRERELGKMHGAKWNARRKDHQFKLGFRREKKKKCGESSSLPKLISQLFFLSSLLSVPFKNLTSVQHPWPGSSTQPYPSNRHLIPSTKKMNQLCKVCGEPAAGYHFGAFTCEGCKSFFGRTYSNLSALGECKNNGQCVINKKNRTSCKSCRLKKCLVVGMSKSG